MGRHLEILIDIEVCLRNIWNGILASGVRCILGVLALLGGIAKYSDLENLKS